MSQTRAVDDPAQLARAARIVRSALARRTLDERYSPPRARVSLVKTRAPRVALYRHYDQDGELLYVGISVRPDLRGRDHARDSHWIDLAVRQEAQWLRCRADALAAEAEAITSERPLFNSQGAGPGRDRRLVEYLLRHGRIELLRPGL